MKKEKIRATVIISILISFLLFSCGDALTDPFYHMVVLVTEGEAESTTFVYEGDYYTFTSPKEREGYTFSCWKTDLGFYSAGERVKITENITAKSVWNKSVKVDYADGIEGTAVVEDEKVTLPRTPERKGYVFCGWSINGEGSYGALEEVHVGSGDIIITALWEKLYAIVIDYNDGRGKEEIVNRGKYYTLPSSPERSNYTFLYWSIGSSEYPAGETIALTSPTTELKAVWEENEYITLSSGSGNFKVYPEEGKITLPRVSEREGYIFNGWLVDGVLAEAGETVSITTSSVIKADWTKLKCVTLDYGGGKVEKRYISSSADFVLPVDPKRSGYLFSKWNVGGTLMDAGETVTVNENITATAVWTENSYWTVTLDYDIDGVSPVLIRVNKGDKYTIPSYTPTKDGDKFVSWMIDGVTQTSGEEITVDKDLTIRAKWTKRTYVKVEFDTDGGEDITAQILKEGEKVVISANPAKTGYTFTGWVMDMGSYSVPFNPLTDTVNYDTTLRAVYKANTYTLTFKDGYSSSTLFSSSVSYGGTVRGVTNPERRGYAFKEWHTEDGSTFNLKDDYLNTSDLTLYAVWTKKSYSVFFIVDTVTKESSSVAFGDTVNPPTENPAKEGETFEGWKTASGEDFDFSTPIEENTYLYASWSSNVYTVTYDANGGDLKLFQSTTFYNKNVSKPQDPDRDGYVFVTWLLEDGTEYDFSTPVTESFTLYASWNPMVYFMSDGALISRVEAETGQTVMKPSVTPSKEGYVFSSWVREDGTEYDFSTPVTEHIVISASFNPTVLNLVFRFPKSVINVDTLELSTEGMTVSFAFSDGSVNGDWRVYSTSDFTTLKEGEHSLSVKAKKGETDIGSAFSYAYTMGSGAATDVTVTVEESNVVDITPTIDGESRIDSSYNRYVKPVVTTKGDIVRYTIGDTAATSSSDIYSDSIKEIGMNDTINVLVETTSVLAKGTAAASRKGSDIFQTIGARGPAGGYVFYDEGSVCSTFCWGKNSEGTWEKVDYKYRYMEASSKMLDKSYTYGYTIIDGSLKTTQPGLSSARLLATKLIMTRENNGVYADSKGKTKLEGTYAAKACDDYSVVVDGVTYDDWYLPCRDQLEIVIEKLGSRYLKTEFCWMLDSFKGTPEGEKEVDVFAGCSPLTSLIKENNDSCSEYHYVLPVRSF